MIDILLATYNGEKYLRDQIDSILKQTYPNWMLLIRDDGSTDGTKEILDEYSATFPERIFVEQDSMHMGHAQSFMFLLQRSTGQYVMFCDQDDIWLPNKVELTLLCIRSCEYLFPNIPILVHTDLRVVNESMELIGASKWEMIKWYPEVYSRKTKRLFVVPFVSGNTAIFNRRAVDASLPFAHGVNAHDVWVAIKVAINNGKIVSVPIQTVLYRQHQKAASGYCKKLSWRRFASSLFRLRGTLRTYRKEHQLLALAGVKISFIRFSYYKTLYLIEKYFMN